jgi:hypothetical protein
VGDNGFLTLNGRRLAISGAKESSAEKIVRGYTTEGIEGYQASAEIRQRKKTVARGLPGYGKGGQVFYFCFIRECRLTVFRLCNYFPAVNDGVFHFGHEERQLAVDNVVALLVGARQRQRKKDKRLFPGNLPMGLQQDIYTLLTAD